MKIKDALDIKRGDIISLVGGGGKTTIIYTLARELTSAGISVITTTTTRIFEPTPSDTPFILVDKDENKIETELRGIMAEYRHVTVVSDKLSNGKMNGISSALVAKIAIMEPESCIIIEADGAAQKSLKAPNLTEPVIPDSTSVVVAVVGIDAVERKLTQNNVFRPEIAAHVLDVPLGEVISAESIAVLLTHEHGIIKGSPVQARIVPFINKMDIDGGLAQGKEVAYKILAKRHSQIDRVILGQARLSDPVIKVIRNTPKQTCL